MTEASLYQASVQIPRERVSRGRSLFRWSAGREATGERPGGEGEPNTAESAQQVDQMAQSIQATKAERLMSLGPHSVPLPARERCHVQNSVSNWA